MLCGGLAAAGAIAGSAAAPSAAPDAGPVADAGRDAAALERARAATARAIACGAPTAGLSAPSSTLRTDWLRLTTRLGVNRVAVRAVLHLRPAARRRQVAACGRTRRSGSVRSGRLFTRSPRSTSPAGPTWVATNGSSWYEAGVEARRRMAATGYDVSAGDTWALNELSSAVRQGTGNARANMRAFLNGLYDGDGTLPPCARDGVRRRDRPGDDRPLPLPGALAGLVRGRRRSGATSTGSPATGRRRSTVTSATTPFPA